MRYLTIAILLLKGVFRAIGAETSASDPFEPARQLFAEAADDPTRIETAIAAFEKLEREQPHLAGRARAYRGALTAMKAQHTRWPHKKWKLLRKGLALMDEGIALNPHDVETLFVHGVACHAMPRLFRRRDDARRDFVRILRLLPDELHHLDPEFVREILQFFTSEMKPTPDEQRRIEEIRSRLPSPN